MPGRQPTPSALILTLSLLAFAFAAGCGSEGSGTSPDEQIGETTTSPDDDPSDVVSPPAETPSPPVVEVPGGPMAGRSPMRLLTRYEYDNTVTDLLGVPSDEATRFPPENVVNGFENNAWMHKVNPSTLRYYLDAAEVLSARAVTQPPVELTPCAGAAQDTAMCHEGIRTFLGRAFRRPPTDDEAAVLASLYDLMVEGEGAEAAVEVVVQAVLQAPQFLYRIELYEPSPMELNPRDGGMNGTEFELVGPYEMANRLSYFLWNSMPDDALFAAAEAGLLNTPDGIKEQVARMLPDPRTREMVRTFNRQWLGLDRVDAMIKDAAAYPEWQEAMRGDMRVSIDAFVDHVYWEEGRLAALFDSQAVFLTPALAPLFGEPVAADSGGVWRVDFPEEERAGLLTQPAMLAMLSYPNQSSPINRAVFLREKILCQHLEPPPADLEIVPPDPDPNLTTRETFAIHTESDTCAGCHVMIDPLGFGFEGYDAIGRHRTVENGKPVDVSGEMVAAPERALNGEFHGAVELIGRFAESEHIARCVADQWFTFAMGRHSDDSDEPSAHRVFNRFAASGYRFEKLFEAIALSDTFRYRKKRAIADAEAEAAYEEMMEQQEENP